MFIASFLITVLLYLDTPNVSDAALHAAMQNYVEHVHAQPPQGTLLVVDYTQPSQSKRLAAVNLQTQKVLLYARVTHGQNSGVVFARHFSNVINSLQSSLGFYQISQSFNGRHGFSYRLIGLDPDINDNAYKRGMLIHSAPYVSINSMLLNWSNGFRLGRSQGCFVLSATDFNKLRKVLVDPAYLYAYAKEEVKK